MPKFSTTLEPDDVVLIPAGSGASIRFDGKSGRRSRVVIDSAQPVTITRANAHQTQPLQRLARKPTPSAG
ncbi:MAG TPA: hypothetical protein VGE09_06210 [Pseudoxanthomonas sp.]